MTLLEYMNENRLSDQAMAELIGDCSEGAVRKWKYRERRPRHARIVRIREVTGGQVTADDFFNDEPADTSGEAAA